MSITFSNFAAQLSVESAFTVLAVAKRLRAAGKDVIELEIGDSPFPSTAAAKRAGIAAIEADQSHYCPSAGGVAAEDDLRGLADLVRGRDIAVLSDEPYDQMVWRGRHRTLLEQPGMMSQCVAAYTFSKSYSMSGWRLGFAVSSPENAEMIAKLVNISLSCVPPLVQLAGAAALREDAAERDRHMRLFHEKVELLAARLNRIQGGQCLTP